jgi:hypothetical protein
MDCDYYFQRAIIDDQAKIDTICANYDFYTVATNSYFLQGPWFGDQYKEDIMTATGMTEAEYTAFYNKGNVNSFGYYLVVDLEDISENYKCPSAPE